MKKTLTLLNLQCNQIRDIGAGYLAVFLKHNKVIMIHMSVIFFYIHMESSCLDAHRIKP